mgnify:CR=1 FL=1
MIKDGTGKLENKMKKKDKDKKNEEVVDEEIP